MAYIIASALVAALVTTGSAWALARRWPGRSARSQVVTAALSFPALAVLVFVVATFVTLVDGAQVKEPGGTVGMVVFALVFFLVYAVFAGVIIGIPTAMVAVRWFRPD